MPLLSTVRVTLLTAVLLATGCGAGDMADVRAMAAQRFTCGRESIEVARVEENTRAGMLYEARGCGQRARYVCEETSEQGFGRHPNRDTSACRAETK